MTRYKQTDFADEETSSIGSIHLNEVRTSPNMHIRFANRVKINFTLLFCIQKLNCNFSIFAELVSVTLGSTHKARKVFDCCQFLPVTFVCDFNNRFAEGS